MPILTARALILKPRVPKVVAQRLDQVCERPGCTHKYNEPVLKARALILQPWAPKVFQQRLIQVCEQSVCSHFIIRGYS